MEQSVSTARVALKYGVLTAIVIMVYTTVLNVAGQALNKPLTYISFIFLIVGLVLAMKNFREENGGYMSYGDGLGLGSLMSAVMGFLSAMFSMLYTRFIDPTILTQAMDQARMDMEARGLSDAQIDSAMEVSQKMMSPGILFVMGVFGYVLMGFLLSLIIAAVLRRDKPVFD